MPDHPPELDSWVEQTSAFDRVRSIAESVSQPRSASWIADESYVSENTARDHLTRLVEMNILLEDTQSTATRYKPDPLHARAQALRDLLDEYDHDGLLQLKEGLQERIEDWKTTYNVTTLEELREQAAEMQTASDTRDVRKTASDWELVNYRLSIVDDAIKNYNTYSRTGTEPV